MNEFVELYTSVPSRSSQRSTSDCSLRRRTPVNWSAEFDWSVVQRHQC